MARKFIYADGSEKGMEIPDHDEKMTPEEVRQWASEFYPELSNAETKTEKKGEDFIYTFKKRVGTKGSKYTMEVEIWDGAYCRDGNRFCQFYWENEDGDYGCTLLNETAPFIEDEYPEKLPKLANCPSLKPQKLEAPISDERG